MNPKNFLLVALTTLIFMGCSTTNHYTGPALPLAEKAIVLTEFSGDGLVTDVVGIRLAEVQPKSEHTKVMFDRTKLEFTPGVYSFSVQPWRESGLLGALAVGMVGGQSALNVYQYGYGPRGDSALENVELEAGGIYILKLKRFEGSVPEFELVRY